MVFPKPFVYQVSLPDIDLVPPGKDGRPQWGAEGPQVGVESCPLQVLGRCEMKKDCPFCVGIVKREAPEWGYEYVIGACRPCAECGVLRYPVYNFLRCSYCKKSGVYNINWIHENSHHVTCYNSIAKMIEVGLLVSTGPFEYKILREERQWSVG